VRLPDAANSALAVERLTPARVAAFPLRVFPSVQELAILLPAGADSYSSFRSELPPDPQLVTA